ncbi:hypothetical protein Tco_0109508 [Tanacetum coccineum]
MPRWSKARTRAAKVGKGLFKNKKLKSWARNVVLKLWVNATWLETACLDFICTTTVFKGKVVTDAARDETFNPVTVAAEGHNSLMGKKASTYEFVNMSSMDSCFDTMGTNTKDVGTSKDSSTAVQGVSSSQRGVCSGVENENQRQTPSQTLRNPQTMKDAHMAKSEGHVFVSHFAFQNFLHIKCSSAILHHHLLHLCIDVASLSQVQIHRHHRIIMVASSASSSQVHHRRIIVIVASSSSQVHYLCIIFIASSLSLHHHRHRKFIIVASSSSQVHHPHRIIVIVASSSSSQVHHLASSSSQVHHRRIIIVLGSSSLMMIMNL